MVGFIPTNIVLEELLENVFSDEVSGIDCVFEAGSQAYTYSVREGVAYLRYEAH